MFRRTLRLLVLLSPLATSSLAEGSASAVKPSWLSLPIGATLADVLQNFSLDLVKIVQGYAGEASWPQLFVIKNCRIVVEDGQVLGSEECADMFRGTKKRSKGGVRFPIHGKRALGFARFVSAGFLEGNFNKLLVIAEDGHVFAFSSSSRKSVKLITDLENAQLYNSILFGIRGCDRPQLLDAYGLNAHHLNPPTEGLPEGPFADFSGNECHELVVSAQGKVYRRGFKNWDSWVELDIGRMAALRTIVFGHSSIILGTERQSLVLGDLKAHLPENLHTRIRDIAGTPKLMFILDTDGVVHAIRTVESKRIYTLKFDQAFIGIAASLLPGHAASSQKILLRSADQNVHSFSWDTERGFIRDSKFFATKQTERFSEKTEIVEGSPPRRRACTRFCSFFSGSRSESKKDD